MEYVWSDEEGERRSTHEQVPGCGLRVPGGLLLGDSRGEWGGELVHVVPGSPPRILLEDNVVALHRMSTGIVAVTGLAHLSLNEGVLYRIDPRADGSYGAKWWKRLPGEPVESGLLDDGSLFVRCDEADIVVSPNGRMRLANDR